MNCIESSYGPYILVGKSALFLKSIKDLAATARYSSNVLISGEPGVGKQLCARKIHSMGPRIDSHLISVNCRAMPVAPTHRDIFGFSYNGPKVTAGSIPGIVSEALGGTLFLHQIEYLPLAVQTKFLEVFEQKACRPSRTNTEFQADIRLIATIGGDPREAIQSGKLHQEVYHCVNTIAFTLPALRDRREDIPLLARHFLRKYDSRQGKRATNFSQEAIEKMLMYDWPANVAELKRVVERAYASCRGPVIDSTHIVLVRHGPDDLDHSFNKVKEKFIEEFEKTYISKLLLIHNGNISKAAKAARKHRRAFWELIRKHKIDVHKFKYNESSAFDVTDTSRILSMEVLPYKWNNRY